MIMYAIDGSEEIEERVLDHLREGYRGAKPVRYRQRGGRPAADRRLRRADGTRV